MEKLVSALLLFAFTFTLLFQDFNRAFAQESNRYSMAVVNLLVVEGELTRTEARVFTARFTDELSQASLFHTMHQNQVEGGLLEQGLDPNGCETFDCAVRAGKALGVELVVYGIVKQTLTGFELKFEMVHVDSRQIAKSYEEHFGGTIAELMDRAPILARKLLGLPVSEPAVTQPEAEPILPEEPEAYYSDPGGGFKWVYVGLGVLVAGGVSAALVLGGNGSSGPTPPPPPGELPGAPSFP